MSHSPCTEYPEKRLKRLIGKGLTLQQIARKRIPGKDKMWVFTRDGVLSEGMRKRWIEVIVERSIRHNLGKSGSGKWDVWAEKWLSGEDRTAYSAYAAAYSANYAYAAYSAAYSAADSAYSAAYSAYSAYYAYYAYSAAYYAASAYYADSAASAASAANERKQQIKDLIALLEDTEAYIG